MRSVPIGCAEGEVVAIGAGVVDAAGDHKGTHIFVTARSRDSGDEEGEGATCQKGPPRFT